MFLHVRKIEKFVKYPGYELALRSGREYRAGDQLSYYVTGIRKAVAVHSQARLVAEWKPEQRDENIAYYLAKLEALYEKLTRPEAEPGEETDAGE